MRHSLKEGILRFSLIFSLLFLFTSAASNSEAYEKKFPIALEATMSNTFYVNGCAVTVTIQVVFIVESTNFILLQVYVSNNIHLQIDCGTVRNPFLYEIRPGDITFDVSNGTINDVDFDSQTDDTVAGIVTDSDFLNEFKAWVDSEKP
jgi:hypothetical protein